MKKSFSKEFICFLGDCLYRDLIEHSTEELVEKLNDSSDECEKEWSALVDSAKARFPDDWAFYRYLEENDLDGVSGDDLIGDLIDAAYYVAHWKRATHGRWDHAQRKH